METSAHTLRLKRVMFLEYKMPEWMESLLHRKMDGIAIEETSCDQKRKVLELRSRNISLGEYSE